MCNPATDCEASGRTRTVYLPITVGTKSGPETGTHRRSLLVPGLVSTCPATLERSERVAALPTNYQLVSN